MSRMGSLDNCKCGSIPNNFFQGYTLLSKGACNLSLTEACHDDVANRILNTVQQRLQQQKLPASLKLWNECVLDGTAGSFVTLSLSSPKALTLLARSSLGRAAESYVQQEIDIQSIAHDVVHIIVASFSGGKDGKKERAPSCVWSMRRHSHRHDRRAIQSHYDVSDSFYGLWLDRQKVCFCAYFKTPENGLDMAQEQKLERICHKLCQGARDFIKRYVFPGETLLMFSR